MLLHCVFPTASAMLETWQLPLWHLHFHLWLVSRTAAVLLHCVCKSIGHAGERMAPSLTQLPSLASFWKSCHASALCVSNSIGHAGDVAAASLTSPFSSLVSFSNSRRASALCVCKSIGHAGERMAPSLTRLPSLASFWKSCHASALCVSNSIGHAGDVAAASLTFAYLSLASFLKRRQPSSGWAFRKLGHMSASAAWCFPYDSSPLTISLSTWKWVSLYA